MYNILDQIELMLEQVFDKLPYAKLKPLDVKARWGIVSIFPLLIFILVYFLLINSTSTETSALREELSTTKGQVTIGRKIKAKLPELEKQLSELNYHLSLMREQLPSKREIPGLLDEISNSGIQSGLEFVFFKPGKEKEEDFYSEVPVSLEMIGSFHDLLRFFDEVSRLKRIITISSLNISSTKKKSKKTQSAGTAIKARCIATTYRYLEHKVDVKKKKKKK